MRNVTQIVNLMRRIGADVKAGPVSGLRERKATARTRAVTDGVSFVDRGADKRSGIGADQRSDSGTLGGVTRGEPTYDRARGCAPARALAGRCFTGCKCHGDEQGHGDDG